MSWWAACTCDTQVVSGVQELGWSGVGASSCRQLFRLLFELHGIIFATAHLASCCSSRQHEVHVCMLGRRGRCGCFLDW